MTTGQTDTVCPICRGRVQGDPYARVQDRLGVASGAFEFFRCATCESVSLVPLPEESEIPNFYPEWYMAREPKPNGNLLAIFRLLEWKAFLHPMYASGAKSVIKMTGIRSGRILEIGCSSGYQLLEFVQRGDFDARGLDIDSMAVEHAQNELGLNVQCSTISEACLPADSFDIVILFNVLEHLLDPVPLIREINRVLKPNGYLAIKTQMIDSLQSVLFRKNWMMLQEAPRHVLLTTSNGIEQVVNSAGMEIVKKSSGPNLENAFSIALSILPSATSAIAFGQHNLIRGIARRFAGIILGVAAFRLVFVEKLLQKSGTMIYIAAPRA